jgi:hypothetical protein
MATILLIHFDLDAKIRNLWGKGVGLCAWGVFHFYAILN